jgi:cell division ATPase FtsA
VRLAEILEFVNNELKYIGKAARLPAGVVLAGGGAKLPAMVELASQELKLSAQIGIPNLSELNISSSELITKAEDPEMACAFGLLLSGADRLMEGKSGPSGLSSVFKKVFNLFTP